jgi:hypothetical protein
MSRLQGFSSAPEGASFNLRPERLGPMPLINHFVKRVGLQETLSRFVPSDQRCAIAHASALAVLQRSIIVERELIYRHFRCAECELGGDQCHAKITHGRHSTNGFDAGICRSRTAFKQPMYKVGQGTPGLCRASAANDAPRPGTPHCTVRASHRSSTPTLFRGNEYPAAHYLRLAGSRHSGRAGN